MKKCLSLIFFVLLFTFMFSYDYDYSVFTFEEVNTLRQEKPIKRLRIYRKVICRYSEKMTFSLNFLNFDKLEKLNEKLEIVFKYTLRDTLKCLDKKNRLNPHLRNLYSCLVRCQDRLEGIKRGLPEKKKDLVDSNLRKCKYLKGLLKKFLFGK